MKLVTYNIQYGKGRDGRVDLARTIAEVAGADLIALQEVARCWPPDGDSDQVRVIVHHHRHPPQSSPTRRRDSRIIHR